MKTFIDSSMLQLKILMCITWSVAFGLPEIIKVGGLFESGDEMLETAFRYAVERVNTDPRLLPNSRLTPQLERVERHDSFQAARKVCDLLSEGMAAMFGPQSNEGSAAVQSTCDVLEVPHIETRWDYRTKRDNHSINLFPHPTALGKAYLDFVKAKDWKKFAIVYEESDALIRLQELLKDPFIRQRQVVVRQFLPHQEYRKLLKELGRAGIKNIVIDVPTKNVQTVLKHAQQVDMMSEYHNYFITSLDLHTVDLEDFQYGGTNITGYKLVDEESSTYIDVLESWRSPMFRAAGREPSLTTEAALLYDATRLFSRALTDLDRGQKIHIKSLSCDTEEPWPHGISLINYMRMINVKGLTGDIKFDHHGFRSDFKLKVLELTYEGLREAGEWNIHTGLNMTTNYTRAAEEIIQSLKNKTLIATTIINAPYTMLKENHESLEGNDKYEGYCIDLLKEIAKVIGFHFKIKQVDDGKYGERNEQGEWNGMIKELIDGRADIAIGDLTITFQREQAVDFTMPFMNLGISILFRKPTKKVPKLFSFLSPLSLEVWVYMATAFLGVSLFLFIVARFSPYEWTNPHPCDPSPDVLQNQFTLLNTLWFTVGCLMQQGCELTPRALSTRVVACIWWFFTLIMVSSYTANLAAFLTVERLVSPIEGAEDLAKQSHIQYGCVESGATQTFFKESTIPTFKRMWAFMQSARPSVFTESNAKGVERVKKENYAFLMESTSIEYIVERECDLMQIGGLLDNKGYGVATPSGSPYRTPLSSAILKLQESGALHILKERWWKQRLGGGKCSKDETSTAGSASALSLANVGGVFVVLGAGLVAACIVAIVEFVWKSRKVDSEEREPLCVLFCRELRFAIFCGGSTKPILPKHSPDDRQAPENGLPFMPLTGFSSVTTKDNFS
ncbi:glutamate receptor ionotropic, kainate 2-like [Argiope bruennichi]|uniref:glutamate receptor ionotropic, kainate 2-like n=1 Tax=Argiope bruennichi TaxID=94029 RepID=UPI0024944A83|nr:glutamate receptor ionotropic, kainate 2-like [Argiope bruennichi]XP_055949950.1 glutamate receptor ionotropic, kainate 2-like [Argiope bruennichi]